MTLIPDTHQVTTCLPGQSWPMGASLMIWQGHEGVNIAVFSRNASAIHCCFFDDKGLNETSRFVLKTKTDNVWHGFFPGLRAGQLYGLRAEGPFEPAAGHRFNPNKLLIDPYARELVGDKTFLSLECGSVIEKTGHEIPEPEDNACKIPKTCVIDLDSELKAGAQITPGPRIALNKTILYEAHVKGLTRLNPDVPEHIQGTYAGLASPTMLAHFKQIGITTLCLLPVQLHIDERHLVESGLSNYWGYNTLGFFIPEPTYASSPQLARNEFRSMVDLLHRNGVEVVIDVVYNHTAESDAKGPTLCWRGLDNASSYSIDGDGHYLNPTGCGNALLMGETNNVRYVMDSLRWWAQVFSVDGFRFDLATTLARDPQLQNNFHPSSALLTAIAQDPILSRLKMIAEPWDVGPCGYQLGHFPSGWQEWNDRFRDISRSYWLRHECTRGQMAHSVTGSSQIFAHNGRGPLASINMITSHDGFNLSDLTSYRNRHNQANAEQNLDGHSQNYSDNAGVEGPSEDIKVLQKRKLKQRALLSTLMLSQGTPQLLAGDEIGHTQRGNNNAYCQDNPITWLDWLKKDEGLISFVANLTALRRRYPALRHARWFDGKPKNKHEDGFLGGCDVAWLRPDGECLSNSDWVDPNQHCFAYVIEVSEENSQEDASERLMVLLNPDDHPLKFVLPVGQWYLTLDSATGFIQSSAISTTDTQISSVCNLSASSVTLLVQVIDSYGDQRPVT